MGHIPFDRFAAEEQGEVLPVPKVIAQVAVERAPGLSALSRGIRRY